MNKYQDNTGGQDIHFSYQSKVDISVTSDKHMLKGLNFQQTQSFPLHTHIVQAFSVCAFTFFPRQRVIRQTLLADWNEESINSRWYHWEKMEHNVENAPCMAPTGCHNQEREQILGMQVQQRG